MKVFWSRQRREYPVKYYADIFEPVLGNLLNCNKTCYSYVAMYTCFRPVNIIHIRKVKIMLRKIHPYMALQPLPGLGLPHKTPPFIPIFSSSPPSSFPCSQVVVYLLNPSEASLRFPERKFFSGVGSYPHAQPPTWRTRVSLFVWVITFDLSGLDDPASSYATSGLALRIT